ncbi:protein downstream neighbor of son homolog isoform X1 [Pangasianodon hypophthalmus]|uniref:protein downstream neighbor of son homolog isoform X1 n=1 Tax=Pangasianodon hypophthalmus TaxID=310915 RepID=UPI002307D313|nr:protein downstream neighbor of son homolog isoform X1 [Pangasianodon hypophthalmus]
MTDQSYYSPSFKKPCDVLRMRRKRVRSAAAACSGSEGAELRPFCPGPLLHTHTRAGGGVKRRNPFANIENTFNSPKKRKSSEDTAECKRGTGAVCEGEEPNANSFLRENLFSSDRRATNARVQCGYKSPAQRPEEPVCFSEDQSLFEEVVFEAEKSTPILKSPGAPDLCSESRPEVCREYPADWSLKTRVLVTSPQSFSWAEHLKAQEEAQGLSLHCRAEYTPLPQNIQDPRSCAELRCGFQQCLQYWQHPSLPWLSLFPRIGAKRSFSGKSTPWAQDAALQQSLMSEWSVSLTSLYSLLKAKLCPYFYLCSYQFTVLFRAAGLSGAKGITALLSPTTRGLREAMKADGIEFSLPLVEEKRKSKENSSSNLNDNSQLTDGDEQSSALTSECSDKEEEQEEDEDDDDECFSWLKEMGVQDKIKKPDAISVKLRKEHNEVRLDHRPESVVLVEGSNTFTLINFLINCKSLVAAAGPQAGLPPTLLAPTAFRGATLHTLKARSVNVKTQVRTGYQDVCSLEVTGPIMPHALHTLTQLLRPAQKGGFSMALYTHEPSAVLNVPVTKPSESDRQSNVLEELSRCGLQQHTVQQLMEQATLGKSALRHLDMRDYSYSWRS